MGISGAVCLFYFDLVKFELETEMALRASVALMSQVGAAGSPLKGDHAAPGSKLKLLGS